MNRHIKNIIISALLIVLPLTMVAQENKQKKPTGFNALEYSLQKRYLKKGVPFENNKFKDNLFFSVMFGLQKIAPNGDASFDGGTNIGLGVGKLFTPTSAARLSLNIAQNGRFIGKPLNRYGIGIDHLYNVTSYIMGYDPNRRLELSTVEGIGVQWASLDKESKMAMDLHLGLQMKIHLNPTFDVFLEPQVGIGTRSLNLAPANERAYNIFYGLSAGVRYIMLDKGFIKTKEDVKLGTSGFWSIGTGAQMHLSDLEGSGIGPSMNIALGRWLMPGVGFRVSGTFSTNTWHLANYEANEKEGTPAYRCYETSSYIGARGEVMFDPIMFFKKYDDEEKFKMKLFVGGEFGKMSKENRNLPIRRAYKGLTGGLQVGYRIQDDLLVYIEPHYTSANYSIPYTNVDASKKFTDNLVSLNVGLEFGTPVISRKETTKAFREFFESQLFVGGSVGFNYPIHSKRFQENSYIDYQASAFVGYNLTPIHGASLNFDINRVSMDMETGYRQFNMISAALNYRFNIINGIQGYIPDKRIDVNMLIGPVITMRKNAKENILGGVYDPFNENTTVYTNTEDNKICIGGEFAIETTYNINEKIGVFLKPQIRLYPHDILPTNNVPGWRKIISCQVGAAYKFNL